MLSVALLAGLAAPAGAQRLNFRNYTGFDGLPQRQVLALAQDRDGFLWLGTYGGLSRYDGRRFTTLTTHDGLGGNAVRDVVVDGEGHLWVGSLGGGVTVVEGGRPVRILRGPEELVADYVEDLEACRDGTVWVSTDAGLTRVGPEGSRHFTVADGLPDPLVRQVRCTRAQGILAATEGGLARFTGEAFEPVETGGLSRIPVRAVLEDGERLLVATRRGVLVLQGRRVRPLDLGEGSAGVRVVDMVRGPGGSVWLASTGGVFEIAGEQVTRLDRRNGLPTEEVHRVMVDREGTVWFGTGAGLSKFVPGPFTAHTAPEWLPSGGARAIAEDADGVLWFGGRRGLARFRPGEERAEAVAGLPAPRVYAAEPLPGGGILVGTLRGLCLVEGSRVRRVWTVRDGLPGNAVLCLAAVPGRREVWVGTGGGTVLWRGGRLVEPGDGALASARPLALETAAGDRLWVGLRAGGLLLAESGRVVARYGPEEGLSAETVWSLHRDGEGGVWVGTNGDGAFHVREGGVEKVSTAEGLVDNFVWQVLRDSRGDVWFYTSRGLDRLHGSRIRHYGRGDGLPDLEGMAGAVLEDRRGNLWFGCPSGVVRYDPGGEPGPGIPPPIFVEGFRSGNGDGLASGAVIGHPPGVLTFELSSPSYRDESAIRFQHRLLPVETRWSYPTESPTITLAAIGPGRYRLEAIAVDADGRRSVEPATVEFAVLAPWWRRPGTVLAGLLVLTAAVVTGSRWKSRRGRLERLRLERMVAERTAELRRLAVTDELTGVANRRCFAEFLQAEIRLLARAPGEARLSLLVFDLDDFKAVNDTWGHEAGDRLLRAVGGALQQVVRSSDLVARIGGDEFAVVLPMTGRAGARLVGAKILETVAAVRIGVEGGEAGVTASVGGAVVAPSGVVGRDIDELISRADTAAYAAKRAGGNRVYLDGETWQ